MASRCGARYTEAMDLGFETIGNACIIAHDDGPVLATDPWLQGDAYFGSWRLSHAVPDEQWENVRKCKYLWISHGHPDHLSLPSLEQLRDKKILVPDHVGGRIARDLKGMDFDVTVMKDGEWIELSPRLRITSIANYNQDAVVMMDIDGNLMIDANDAGDRGASHFLARELPRFTKRTFLACLTGYGDADMINFVDEQGNRVPPAAARKQPVGPQIAELLHQYGIGYFAPSSSMHRYNRTDCAWADEYATPIEAHGEGFESDRAVCLPAFVQFDLNTGEFARIDPPANDQPLQTPEEFGDDWTTPLSADDVDALRRYFHRVEHLQTFLGYINFRVGGKDHVIDVNREHQRGVTFHTPRQSLMKAVEWHAFDDILIGNFCITTLHGDWHGKQNAEALYPDFTPFVTKFGDNGCAWTGAEIRRYFEEYLRRGFTHFGPSVMDVEMKAALQRYLG